ncbi:MAG: adenylate/guanylate cyclase domain-containing protein [Actinomycetota bacterium]|nr:adenylate/guanylate cyclase domain-containing protein [Actinomycetota bacterium]
MQPKTLYARRDDVNVAYQVVGEGPIDLLFAPGFVSHVDLYWTDPMLTSFMRRLASFSRLVIFDKPGTGASDPVARVPTLEERVEDMRAVLDAAGSERAALFGISEGGPMSALFAATYPDRITSLVVYGSFAKMDPAPDYFPETQAQHDAFVERIYGMVDRWGQGDAVDIFAPSQAGSATIRSSWALLERAAASPAMVRAVVEAARQVDVRAVLTAIRVPTLVLHRTNDSVVSVHHGRFIADRIPDARFVEFPGVDHLPWLGGTEPLLEEMEEFLTGTRQAPDLDRVLATVLFTDIVGSTERAAEIGDGRWRELLEAHDELVRAELERFGGREVKAMGDGFLAAFDGPGTAIKCAGAINEGVRRLGLDVRAGVHTGECERRGEDLGGMAVHIGARVGAKAVAGEVLVSSTVKELVVGSGIEFEDRGCETLRGVPGEWRLFAVRTRGEQPAVMAVGGEGEGLPEPDEHLRPTDRARIALAKRLPRSSRAINRLAMRRLAKR